MKYSTIAAGNASLVIDDEVIATDKLYSSDKINTELSNKINISEIGVADGIAELNSDGIIPASQLPSYVDDVIIGDDLDALDALTFEESKIYVAKDTNITYRWDGSGQEKTDLIEIGSSLTLGETSSTAYRGDRGKIAYDHSQTSHAPSDAEVNVNSDWDATSGDEEILNKPSIPVDVTVSGSGTVHPDNYTDTTYSEGDGGLTTKNFTTALKDKVDGVADNANNYSHPDADGDKHIPANGTSNEGKVLTAGADAGVYTWETASGGGGGMTIDSSTRTAAFTADIDNNTYRLDSTNGAFDMTIDDSLTRFEITDENNQLNDNKVTLKTPNSVNFNVAGTESDTLVLDAKGLYMAVVRTGDKWMVESAGTAGM